MWDLQLEKPCVPLWGLTVSAPNPTSIPVVPCTCDFCTFTKSLLKAIGKSRRQLWVWGWWGADVYQAWGRRNKCSAALSRLKPDPCCWSCGTGLTPPLPHLHSPTKEETQFYCPYSQCMRTQPWRMVPYKVTEPEGALVCLRSCWRTAYTYKTVTSKGLPKLWFAWLPTT